MKTQFYKWCLHVFAITFWCLFFQRCCTSVQMARTKKPAAPEKVASKPDSLASKGRSRSCQDFDGLKEALELWVCKINFITYPSDRKIKSKDVQKLKIYLPHLKRIQKVDRTFNFSLKLIDEVLQQLNQARCFLGKITPKKYCTVLLCS